MQNTLIDKTFSAQVVASRKTLQIKPIKPFGAEIFGLKIDEIGSEEVLLMRQSLLQHKMLLVRNKLLSPNEQIALTKIFGWQLQTAGPSLRHLPEFPEIFRISNREGHGLFNTGHYWHSDGHFIADPSAVTVMHVLAATPDGATLVADSQAAFQALPDDTKGVLARYGLIDPRTGVGHPVVCKHPLTGVLGLYVNLDAIAIDRSNHLNPLVNKLIDYHLSRSDSLCEYKWHAGDTMILDNFSTSHRGTPSDPSNLRIMHRTTVTGPSVWWRGRRPL